MSLNINTHDIHLSISNNGRSPIDALARRLGIWHPEALEDDEVAERIEKKLAEPRTVPRMPRASRRGRRR